MKSVTRNRVLIMAVGLFCLVFAGANLVRWFLDYDTGLSISWNENSQSLTVTGVSEEFVVSGDVQVGDVILSLNGQTVTSSDDLRAVAESSLFVKRIELVLQRDGARHTALIVGRQKHRMTARQVVFALIGLVTAVLGFWIAFSRPNYLAAVLGGLGVFGLGIVLIVQPFYVGMLGFFSGILMIIMEVIIVFTAIAFFHFSCIFPRENSWARRGWPIKTAYWSMLLFIPGVLRNISFMFPAPLEAFYQSWNWLLALPAQIWLAAILSLTIFNLIRTYIGLEERLEKRRFRSVMVGLIVPLGYILFHVILENFFNIFLNTPIWIRAVSFLILPVTFFYGIVRYRSLDTRVIARQGLIYTFVTSLVLLGAGLAFLLFFVLPLRLIDALAALGSPFQALQDFFSNQTVQHAAIAAWALALGSTVGKIKKRVQDVVDRMFYRDQHNFRQALGKYAEVLDQSHSPEKFCDRIIYTLEEFFHPRFAAVALRLSNDSLLVQSNTGERLDLNMQTFARLAELVDSKPWLGRSELEEEVSGNVHPAVLLLSALRCDMLVPVRNSGQVVGSFILSEKKGGNPYTREDLDLLKLLASQTGIALERMLLARKVVEAERARQELEIGREIQRSMLPASMPQIPGVQVAAVTIPASEVGGDFYTFIEYPDGRLGVIAGDIVGKGVGGALNMAATLSSLSIIAEEGGNISSILDRLNYHINRKSTHRTFAAVVFGILDPAPGSASMHWCSAGLPDPVLIGADGTVEYMESPHYSYPPGASRDSHYEEMFCRLQSGDAVLFVSDGVTEAMDPEGRQFGFDALLRTAEKHRNLSPDDFINALKEDVFAFTQGRDLDDDFTAVLVKVRHSSV